MLSSWLSNTSTKRLRVQNVDVDSDNLCKKFDIFLISTVDRDENCRISHAFSGFKINFNKISFLDLGCINLDANDSLTKIKEFLKAKNKHLIILDPDFKGNYKNNAILVSSHPGLLDFKSKDIRCISYQRHYISKELELNNSIHKSLGEINKNIATVEPMLRSCSSLYFELSSIKSTEFSEFGENFNPVGLSILQACQIARYCGFSKNLKEITISDFRMDSIAQCHTIALWTWYYIEGRDLDSQAELEFSKDVTSYIVNSSILDTEIEFIKENKSERWWLVDPENIDAKIPCMYEDYLAVINEDSEDKILELLKSGDNAL